MSERVGEARERGLGVGVDREKKGKRRKRAVTRRRGVGTRHYRDSRFIGANGNYLECGVRSGEKN